MNQLKEDKSSATPWLEERTILLAPTGSYAYGTNTPTSDKDYKGVCIPPIEYYLGMEAFNEYNTAGGKNFKNTKDDIDINIIHINKFVKDAMQGVPNNIEILNVRAEDYIKVTELGQILIDNRHLFLSKAIYRKFRGYANSQKQKMIIKKSNGTGRQDLIEEFGYDTKFFMHTVRLQTSAIEILNTGTYSTYRPNREFLLDCRLGKYTLDQALKIVDDLDRQLEEAYEKCTILPATPDYDKINQMLIDINKTALYL
ncbi:hypothetical protein CVD28_24590 [Bacillus sp. M6-12]|nr:hypothetical protein CVD28_24590 [Bacillus sp. M6-12]